MKIIIWIIIKPLENPMYMVYTKKIMKLKKKIIGTVSLIYRYDT